LTAATAAFDALMRMVSQKYKEILAREDPELDKTTRHGNSADKIEKGRVSENLIARPRIAGIYPPLAHPETSTLVQQLHGKEIAEVITLRNFANKSPGTRRYTEIFPGIASIVGGNVKRVEDVKRSV
jgi:hypothetical protein